MFFTVIPHGPRVPTGEPLKAYLLTDNWDDWFKYNTTYVLYLNDAQGQAAAIQH